MPTQSVVTWKTPVMPRGAVNTQNSRASGRSAVAGFVGRSRRSTRWTSRPSQTSATAKAIPIGSPHATATAKLPPPARTATATANVCTAALPIRSTSAFGTIVPNPRVAAMATVYADDSGTNTASTRM